MFTPYKKENKLKGPNLKAISLVIKSEENQNENRKQPWRHVGEYESEVLVLGTYTTKYKPLIPHWVKMILREAK